MIGIQILLSGSLLSSRYGKNLDQKKSFTSSCRSGIGEKRSSNVIFEVNVLYCQPIKTHKINTDCSLSYSNSYAQKTCAKLDISFEDEELSSCEIEEDLSCWSDVSNNLCTKLVACQKPQTHFHLLVKYLN